MKIFIFNRPKQTIINILFIIGILSLFINILAIGTFVLWKYYPQTVAKIDKMIPDFYGDKIKRLHKNALEAKTEGEKLLYYTKLYNELKDISTLNKYYHIRQKSAKWLVKYYIKQKKLSKALSIAKYWEKNYPYDFNAKFIYLDTLSLKDNVLALNYIEKIYKMYPDILEAKDKYIEYLLKQKMYNKALKISLNSNIVQNEVKFQVYYIDNANSFSEKQSVKLYENGYTIKDRLYDFRFNKRFIKLKGIRIDIDSVSNRTVVSNVNLTINGMKADIKNTNQLMKLSSNKYKIIGTDPYFVFKLPKQLQNYNGNVTIEFSCKIKKENTVIKKILKNTEWQLFFDKGNGFNEQNSVHFKLSKKNNIIMTQNRVNFKNISNIRLDFPSLKGLKIYDFRIVFDNGDTYTKKDISSLNAIKKEKGYLFVENIDPYVTIRLKKQTNIKNIKIEIEFYRIEK